MKRLFFSCIVLITCMCSCTVEKEENNLRRRFEGYLKAVSGMNIDSIQAYTYPKLFTLLSRSESRKSMERSYKIVIKEKAALDSVKIDTIFPVLHIDKGSYAKAIFSMTLRVPMDSTEDVLNKNILDTKRTIVDTKTLNHPIGEKYPSPQSTLLATLNRNKYGMEFIISEEKNGMRTMRVRIMTIAVKDEFAKEWSFFTVSNDQELINKLFPKKVLEKLASKD